MARVRSVIARSTCETSMLKVSASTSTKTGRMPKSAAASAVAMKVNGVVMTSSPGCNPNERKEICSASVPLPQATTCLQPKYRASASSKRRTTAPFTKALPSMTSDRAASTSALIFKYCACSSNMGIFSLMDFYLRMQKYNIIGNLRTKECARGFFSQKKLKIRVFQRYFRKM